MFSTATMYRAVTGAAGIALAAALLTACSKTSTSCHDASCDVQVSGNAEVDLGLDQAPGDPDQDHKGGPDSFEITGYDDGSVSISSSGDEQTVRSGQTQKIGALTFRVISVRGDSAKLHVDG